MDRKTIRRALLDMRVAFDDADAVVEDMLLPPRQRELGPALHLRQYMEAHAKVLAIIAYLMSLFGDEGEPDDRSGNDTLH